MLKWIGAGVLFSGVFGLLVWLGSVVEYQPPSDARILNEQVLPRITSRSEAEAIVQSAITARYPAPRYDPPEVRVSNCTIHVLVSHRNVCETAPAHTLVTREYYIDLRHFHVNRDRGSVRPGETLNPALTGYLESFSFDPIPDQAATYAAHQEQARKQINAARAEVGWGEDAAVLASKRFLDTTPRESLPAFASARTCGNKSWTSPRLVSPFSLHSQDPHRTRAALLYLDSVCAGEFADLQQQPHKNDENYEIASTAMTCDTLILSDPETLLCPMP